MGRPAHVEGQNQTEQEERSDVEGGGCKCDQDSRRIGDRKPNSADQGYSGRTDDEDDGQDDHQRGNVS